MDLVARVWLVSALLFCGTAYAGDCADYLTSPAPQAWIVQRAESQRAWNVQFSDPRAHTPSNYTYLVHGVIIRTGRRTFADAYEFLRRGVSGQDREYIISASLISNESLSPYPEVPAGFIFEVVPENILTASNEDIILWNSQERDLSRRQTIQAFQDDFLEYQRLIFSRNGLLSPQEVVKNTNNPASHRRTGTSYNEVALLNRSSRPNPIIGIFISSHGQDGVFSDPKVVRRLQREARSLARRLNLPLVEF